MQQEYTPYGPEWAKEIKKLTKDQIIDNLLRPALMKAKAEPAALPDNKEREIAFVKWLGENCNYWPKSEEGAMNSKTYSLEQLHGIWEQSRTNKPQ